MPHTAGGDATPSRPVPRAGVRDAGVRDAEPDPLDLPRFVHEYLRGYIALADTKAGVLFTGAAALLAYVESKGGLDVGAFLAGPFAWRSLAGLAAGLFLTTTAGIALRALLPRLGTGAIRYSLGKAPPAVLSDDGRPAGVIFWDDVLAHGSTFEAYADRLEAMTSAEVRRAVARHSWTLAGINRAKYADVSRASLVGLAAFVCTVLFVVLPKPRPPARAADPTPAMRPARAAAVPPPIQAELPATAGPPAPRGPARGAGRADGHGSAMTVPPPAGDAVRR